MTRQDGVLRIVLIGLLVPMLLLTGPAAAYARPMALPAGGSPAAMRLPSTTPPSLTLAAIESSAPAPVPYPTDWPSSALSVGAYDGSVHALIELWTSPTLSDGSVPGQPWGGASAVAARSAEQFANEYSLSSPSYLAIAEYFGHRGNLSVNVYPDRLAVEITGPAASVGSALGIGFGLYEAAGNEIFYAPVGAPHLPSALASLVTGVYGLDDYGRASFDLAVGAPVSADPSSSSGYPEPINVSGTQLLWGSDLQVAYDETPLLAETNASGVSVATVLWAGDSASGAPVAPYVPSDLTNYYNATLPAGEPRPTVIGEAVDGALPPGPSAASDATGANLENTLDLEMVGSLAPGATVYNVVGPNDTLPSLLDAFVAAVNLNVSVITNSWEYTDMNESGWLPYFEEAARRGITVLASSGDSGDNPISAKWLYSNANPYGVGFPADVASNSPGNPYGVLAVGGTTLTLTPGLHRASEVAWYEAETAGVLSSAGGSVGGVSSYFAEPYWQTASQANAAIALTGESGRGVPDLAAVANDTLMGITMNGFFSPAYPVGGTSVASPVVAGIVAEGDAVLSKERGTPTRLGYFDPGLASLGTEQSRNTIGDPPLFDVTQGGNARFRAGPGYDLVTGWGVPNAYNLTMWLANSTVYPVTFTERGLAVAAAWSVTFGGTTVGSTGSTLALSVPNGTYLYTVSAIDGYTISPSSGSLSVVGEALSLSVSFAQAREGVYPVVFSESGLLPGANWSADLNGTTLTSGGPTIAFAEPNGSYNLTILPVEGYDQIAPLSPIVVDGAAVFHSVEFFDERIPSVFTVRFEEGGLPVDGAWAVVSGGHLEEETGTTIILDLVNGTYPFFIASANTSYHADPGSGAAVVDGADQTIVVNFTTTTYPVELLESGLPVGASWVVSIDGGVQTVNETSSTVTVMVANGTHLLEADAVAEFWLAAGAILVTMAGERLVEGFTFSSPLGQIGVDFVESGLPTGQPWTVTYDQNLTVTSTTDSIGFVGSFSLTPYAVAPSGRYVPKVPGGRIEPFGTVYEFPVAFGFGYPVTVTVNGLPTGARWSLEVNSSRGLWFANSTTGSATLTLANGTYSYLVSSPGFSSVRLIDQTLNGTTGSDLTATFSKYAFPVTFTESGVPGSTGATWYVNLTEGPTGFSVPMNGSAPAGSPISFLLINGTYTYSVATSDKSYTATPSTGLTATVSPSASAIGVTFTASSAPPASSLSTLEVAAIAGGVGIVIVLAAVALLLRRRGGERAA